MNTNASSLAVSSLAAAPITPAVTERERYLFDLQGFLVAPDAIDPALCAELDADVTRHLTDEVDPAATHHRFMKKEPLLAWGPAWRRLIDNPRIMPYLDEFISTEMRLDHDYADVIRKGGGHNGSSIHGGATPFDECFFYLHQNGRIRSSLTVVAYALRDVGPGEGGFGCIPGSHKSNYPVPASCRELATPDACMTVVPAKAGSAIIFTEALAHGTAPWRGVGERRTVFYKYSPRTISWCARYYRATDYPDLTPAQAALLEAPNARYGGRSAM